MLVGTFEHNLDGKNRVFVPAKFRDDLGEVFIYRYNASNYPSIQLYSKEEFEASRDEALAEARDRKERRDILAEFYMGAGEASYDSQGRIVLGQLITKQAMIEKQCIFVGFGDYVEVMSPEVYNNYLNSITDNSTLDEQARADERNVYRAYKSEGKLLNLGSKG